MEVSLWQKRVAWDAALQCARALALSLQHAPILPTQYDVRPDATCTSMQLAPGQLVLLLRDNATRLTGVEGKLSPAAICDGNANLLSTGTGAGAEEQVPYSFDNVSHVVLPWPVPDNRQQEDILKSPPDSLRGLIAPSFSRYSSGQEIVVLHDGTWSDAVVLSPPDDTSSTVHRIQVHSGDAHLMLHLHCWNHSPRNLSTYTFESLRLWYSSALASQHRHLTDCTSGKSLNLHSQYVPVEIAAAEKHGLKGTVDFVHLYDWLRTAHASRCRIPSTLSRLQRLVSQGVPDDVAARLGRELIDLSSGLPKSQARGASALQAGARELTAERSASSTESDALAAKQRAELEEYSASEKSKDESFRSIQYGEQEQLDGERQLEVDQLLTVQRSEMAKVEGTHQAARLELTQREMAAKKQKEQTLEVELKQFKEVSLREAERHKRERTANKTETEKILTADYKNDQEMWKASMEAELSGLTSQEGAEIAAFVTAQEEASASRIVYYTEATEKLLITQGGACIEFDATQEAAMQTLLSEQANRDKGYAEFFEDGKKKLSRELDDERKKTVAAQRHARTNQLEDQADERKQLVLDQKAELKDLVEDAQRQRVALANRQDADRKDEFKRRRAGEKSKEPDAKKPSPQKERDALDAQLQEKRDQVAAQHEVDANKFMSIQADKVRELQVEHEESLKKLDARHKESRAKFEGSREGQREKLVQTMKEEREAFEQKQQTDKEAHTLEMKVAREELEASRERDIEALRTKGDDDKTLLVTQFQTSRSQLIRSFEEQREQLDIRLDEKRKLLASSYEEELSSFTSKQVTGVFRVHRLQHHPVGPRCCQPV